jgi:hypothetical protein
MIPALTCQEPTFRPGRTMTESIKRQTLSTRLHRRREDAPNSSAIGYFVFSIAIAMTILIIAGFVLQFYSSGRAFPFEISSVPLTLGETGDFVGGWFNSVALVWIITVAISQYSDLRFQRQELKLMYEEYMKQTESTQQQANASREILRLERKRAFIDQMTSTKKFIHEVVISALRDLSALEEEKVYSHLPPREEHGSLESIRHSQAKSLQDYSEDDLLDAFLSAMKDMSECLSRNSECDARALRFYLSYCDRIDSIVVVVEELKVSARESGMIAMYEGVFRRGLYRTLLSRCVVYEKSMRDDIEAKWKRVTVQLSLFD